jgi:hypothetical protein
LTKFLSIQDSKKTFIFIKKQSSKTAIANYQNNKTKNINKSIDAISKITLEILHATTLHQAIENMSLETTVKETLFSDFK